MLIKNLNELKPRISVSILLAVKLYKYIANKNLATWVMKNNNELVGFYEYEFHPEKNEIELINLGILKKFRGKNN